MPAFQSRRSQKRTSRKFSKLRFAPRQRNSDASPAASMPGADPCLPAAPRKGCTQAGSLAEAKHDAVRRQARLAAEEQRARGFVERRGDGIDVWRFVGRIEPHGDGHALVSVVIAPADAAAPSSVAVPPRRPSGFPRVVQPFSAASSCAVLELGEALAGPVDAAAEHEPVLKPL